MPSHKRTILEKLNILKLYGPDRNWRILTMFPTHSTVSNVAV